MPELPEVETIRRQLDKMLAGQIISRVEVRLPKIIKTPLGAFKKSVAGAKIKGVTRRAKNLIIELNNGWSILTHLKLTGQLIYKPAAVSKHTHVIFYFRDGHQLIYNDLRQFGYFKLIKTEDVPDFFLKEKIGPEPLAKDFSLADFMAIVKNKPRARIKQFLMDPKNIAGIGNIYSDEILFVSCVHPLRPNQTLKPAEVKVIYQAIKKILTEAIKYRGTSANDYLDAHGQEGKFFQRLKVYGREDENCPVCGGKIKRIKIGGRSAHFCLKCQRP